MHSESHILWRPLQSHRKKQEGEVALFSFVGKCDRFLSNFSYCCPCLGTPGSCQLCGRYRGGLAPPGRQICVQGCCWCVRHNSGVSCASCSQPGWSAQAVCVHPGLTRQIQKNLQILSVNLPAAEVIQAFEVHFGTKVLQSYKCLQLSWTNNLGFGEA